MEFKMQKIIISTLFFGFVFGADDTIITLDQGQLVGSSMKSRNGREFKAFQGIPYAKPPIGDLRFKDPVAADPWNGVLNATTDSQACIQKNLFFYQQADVLVGSEDYLYLNVYTPKIPEKKGKKLLPVMVWIPGGGYFAGSRGSSTYGPQYLLDKDIVLVAINYRIGILGFLTTEDDVLPGNYGMKDQVTALQWVKNNIDKFGGNPKSVTIFGQSAGAASVGLHLLSPMSKGLFHKAIMSSASPLNIWGVVPPGYGKRRASAISTISGCPTEPEDMVKCLRELPAKVLVNIYEDLFVRMYNATNMVYNELNEDFNHYVSSFLMYRYTAKYSDIPVIGKKVFERYFPDGTLEDPLDGVRMLSSGLITNGVFNTANNLSSPVYYYSYEHINYVSFNSIYGPYPYPKKLGSMHADDTISLFFTDGMGDLKGEDLKVSELMVNIWTNFASTDKMTIDGTTKGKNWPKFESNKYKLVQINSSSPVISDSTYYSDELKFWNDLPILSRFEKTSRTQDEL